MSNINRLSSAPIMPQAHQHVRELRPTAKPKGLDITGHTPKSLTKLRQSSQQQTDLGKVGSTAQIADLKARVQSMDVSNLEQPPQISRLRRFGNWVGGGLSATKNAIKGAPKALYKAVAGGIDRGKQDKKLGESIQSGKLALADQARHAMLAKERLPHIKERISDLMSDFDNNQVEIADLYKEAYETIKGAGVDLPTLRDASINPPVLPGSLAMDLLGGQGPILDIIKDNALQKGEALTRLGDRLKSEGGHSIAQETIAILQKASPAIQGGNFIAQLKMASDGGHKVSDVLAGDIAGVGIESGALSAVAGIGGGLQILSEGYELYQNYNRLDSALSRQEMSRALLASPDERQKTIAKLESQIQELNDPGRVKKFFSKKTTRQTEAANLSQKIAEIRNLPEADSLNDNVKNVAKQALNRTDKKFKMARIAKNVLGIAAGSIAIAVAVGALASPVGWVAAGIALTATVACIAYAKHTTGSRQGKIDDLQQTIQNADAKMEAKTENRTQLQGQLNDVMSNIEGMMRDGIPDSEQSEMRSRRSELESQIQTINEDLDTLGTLKTEASMQLLAVSPDAGATAIIEGLQHGDEETRKGMRFLAKAVLGVGEDVIQSITSGALPQDAAINVLKRNMSIDPRL